MADTTEASAAAPPAEDEQPPTSVEAPVADWRRPSIDTVVALGLVFFGLWIGLTPLHDNSFMTHLATGRLILDTGSIPRSDPYSFTAFGEPWTVQSWGASVIYGWLDATFGLVGIRAVVAAGMAGLTALAWRLTRPAGSLVPRVLLTVLVIGIGAFLWSERPLLFGLLCLCAVLLAVEGVIDPRWLVPVMWIWVNVHGSFPIGLAAIVVLGVGRWLDKERPDTELRVLGWATLGTALGAVNPLGPSLLAFPLQLLGKREAFSQIVEWQPPSWGSPSEWFFAVQLGLAVLICLFRGRRWRVALPILVFGAASLLSVRNVAQTSFVLLPGMALCLAGIGRIDGRVRPRIARPLAAGIIAFSLLVAVVSLTTQPDTDLSDYPEEAVGWMHDEGLLGLDQRVVSRDFVGNYLEARYGPDEVRVFFDDRVDMYPMPIIRDYSTLVDPRGRYQGVLDRAEATAVLWDRDSPFGRWLEDAPGWTVVHRDADWLVVVPAG